MFLRPWCHELFDGVVAPFRGAECSLAGVWRPFCGGLALLALGLSSCVLGGQTGGEEGIPRGGGTVTGVDDDDNGSDSDDPVRDPGSEHSVDGGLAVACAAQREPITADNETSVGFAPSLVLAWAVGRRESTLLWNDDTGLVVYGPESGEGSLVLTVAYAQGAINLVTFPDAAVCGEPYVEIEALASLTTREKALDEVFPVTLLARTADAATFTADLSLSKLEGALVLDLPAAQLADHLVVEATLVPDSSSGTVYCPIEQTTADTITEMVLPLMRWPSPALLSKTTDK